jgi:hypothetical protein
MPLTPPDYERCQAEKPNGNTFMTLGGQPGLERCTSKPTTLVKETKVGEDGQKGSMTMCAACLTVFLNQVPQGSFTFEDLKESPDGEQ